MQLGRNMLHSGGVTLNLASYFSISTQHPPTCVELSTCHTSNTMKMSPHLWASGCHVDPCISNAPGHSLIIFAIFLCNVAIIYLAGKTVRTQYS